MFSTTFTQANKNGRYAEQQVQEFIQEKYPHLQINNVSKEQAFFSKDIDLIVTNKNTNNDMSIEIKNETYNPKNWDTGLFFETLSNSKTKKQGWVYKSQADLLFKYKQFKSYNAEFIVIVPMQTLKNLVYLLSPLKTKQYTKDKLGNVLYYSQGVWISYTTLIHHGMILNIFHRTKNSDWNMLYQESDMTKHKTLANIF
jgi:hypothetical protein